MGVHLIDGDFQSDKYPTCPRGKVPLSTKDPTAQSLLWEYAQRRRAVDAEFADDLEEALRNHGYDGDVVAFGDYVSMQRGHNRRGCGWFVWETEYPEEGSSFFESEDDAVAYAEELRESLESE